MPTVSTRPPNRLGEMLSTCSEPEDTASPCMANLQQLDLATAAWAAAHSPPPPRPRRRPPNRRGHCPAECPCEWTPRSRSPDSAPAAWPAARGPRCSSPDRAECRVTTPVAPVITTPGLSVRSTVTWSPSTSTEKPRMSKPMATFAADAGANAVAVVFEALTDAPRDTSTHAAGRRTRPPPSPRDPRPDPAR